MTEAATFYVYAYLRSDGRPCYVGKGKGERWVHRGHTGRNKHFVRILAQAKAAGLEMPRMKLVEGLGENEALHLERFFIAALGREMDGGPLVNLSLGGDNGPVGCKWTAEQRAEHSVRMRKRVMPPEWRAAVSAGMKKSEKVRLNAAKAGAASKGSKKRFGWWSTEEGRAKQRANNSGHTGHRHSDEARAKIRAKRAVQTNILNGWTKRMVASPEAGILDLGQGDR